MSVPPAVEVDEKLVHALPRHIAMNERLRQAFGSNGRRFEVSEAQRDCQRLRTVWGERDPRGDSTNLVAGAFDEHAFRLKASTHQLPGLGDVSFVVLAKHIECANDIGSLCNLGWQRSLESSAFKGDAGGIATVLFERRQLRPG